MDLWYRSVSLFSYSLHFTLWIYIDMELSLSLPHLLKLKLLDLFKMFMYFGVIPICDWVITREDNPACIIFIQEL